MTAEFRRRPGRWWWRGAIALGVAALAMYATVCLISADVLTRPHNRVLDFDPRLVSQRGEPWTARTSDGVALRGWFYPNPESRRLVVLVHGMEMCWPQMAGLGRDLHRRGYNLLMFDLRGHGRSDPARLTLGQTERHDLRAVLAWAKRAGFAPERIGWLGYSMGASTLLMEGAHNPDFRAVVLDSGFGDLPDLLNTQLTLHSGLPSAFNPGILLAAWWAFGVRAHDLVPLRDAPFWRGRPLLVIHGELDDIVPVAHARRIARLAGPTCRPIILPGIGHIDAYRANPGAYVATVDRFFRANLDDGELADLDLVAQGVRR